jgi:N-acetylglucosaminyldiphosphoundecaprenol N-acetyl-beta-D-mannosaminyltransferase
MSAEPREPPAVGLGPIAVHALTEAQCVALVMQRLAEQRGGWIVTLNLHHWLLFGEDPGYAELCRSASLRVADGMPLIWASRLRGTALPERVAGSNLIWSLSAAAAQRGVSIFLLGGDPGVAQLTSLELQRRFPGLRIAGICEAPRGWSDSATQSAAIVRQVVDSQPGLVFVALSLPDSDRLIACLSEKLPHTWLIGVGISFSFVAGTVRRAPLWLQRAGLEWLHRVYQEPRRLTPRYVRMLWPAWRLLRDAARSRLG